jgi:glyoxylase I family protein
LRDVPDIRASDQTAKILPMTSQIDLGGIHHLRLTVTDLERSRAFYRELLGFQVVADSPLPGSPEAEAAYPVLWGGVVMAKGALVLGLRPVAPEADRFDEDRVGLDHLSFNVPDRAALDAAKDLFAEHGVPHGDVRDLPAFGIAVLPFRDPDNIQLEIAAPLE